MKYLKIVFQFFLLCIVVAVSLFSWFETVDLIYLVSFGILEWPMDALHAGDHLIFFSYFIIAFVIIISVAVWGDFSPFFRKALLLFGLAPLAVSLSIHLGGGYRSYIGCDPEYPLTEYLAVIATDLNERLCDDPWVVERMFDIY